MIIVTIKFILPLTISLFKLKPKEKTGNFHVFLSVLVHKLARNNFFSQITKEKGSNLGRLQIAELNNEVITLIICNHTSLSSKLLNIFFRLSKFKDTCHENLLLFTFIWSFFTAPLLFLVIFCLIAS